MPLVERFVVRLQDKGFDLLSWHNNAGLLIVPHDTFQAWWLALDAGYVAGKEGGG